MDHAGAHKGERRFQPQLDEMAIVPNLFRLARMDRATTCLYSWNMFTDALYTRW